MALVQLALPVTAIKGSVGGVTWQQNRSGQILRTRPKTHKNSTTKQQLSHQDQQKYLYEWQQLSFANRQLWNDYANVWTKPDFFGTAKKLTGLNWFESINRNRVTVSNTIVSIPPTHNLPENIVLFALTANSANLFLTFFTFFNPADNALFIRLTNATRRVSTTIRSELRLSQISLSGPYSVINLTASWESTFGISWPPSPIFSGYHVCVSVQTCNKTSGLISPALVICADMLNTNSGVGSGIVGSTLMVNNNPGVGVAQVGISNIVN